MRRRACRVRRCRSGASETAGAVDEHAGGGVGGDEEDKPSSPEGRVEHDLNHILVDLLDGHGVTAHRQGAVVLVGEHGRSARLSATPSPPSGLLLSITAESRGDTIQDLWLGIGSDTDTAIREGIGLLCLSSFHVILAAAWGILERDQVDHQALQAADGHWWDLYVGPTVSRASQDARLDAPDLIGPLIGVVRSSLTVRKARWGRLYAGGLNGELTLDGLLDSEPHEPSTRMLTELDWRGTASGFASQRLFWAAVPRDGEAPAHQIDRNCGAV